MDSSALPAHLGFVAAAYAIVAVVLAGLVGYLLADHRRLRRRIGDLEARGVTRRNRAESGR